MSTNIKISEWSKDILDAFKKAEEHTSLDSVIRSLIMQAVINKGVMAAEFKEHPTFLDAKSRYLGIVKVPSEKRYEEEMLSWKNHLIKTINSWEDFDKEEKKDG